MPAAVGGRWGAGGRRAGLRGMVLVWVLVVVSALSQQAVSRAVTGNGICQSCTPKQEGCSLLVNKPDLSRRLQRKRRNGRFPLRHEVEQNQRSAQKLHRGSGQLRAPDPPFSSGRLGEAVAAGTGSKTQSLVKTGRARPSCSPNSSSQHSPRV